MMRAEKNLRKDGDNQPREKVKISTGKKKHNEYK